MPGQPLPPCLPSLKEAGLHSLGVAFIQGHDALMHVIKRLDNPDLPRRKALPGQAAEGVDIGPFDRGRPGHPRPFALPEAHPCQIEIFDREWERRSGKLGLQFIHHILPFFPNGAIQAGLQPVTPRPPLLYPIKIKTALGPGCQAVSERGVKEFSSPMNSRACSRSWPLR